MVLDQTEDALVVVTSALWAESDDYALRGVWLDHTLSHRERVHITLIGEKLKRSWQVAVVHDVEQAVGSLLSLNFTEVDGLGA
jgi:hypothetical protein